MKEYIDFSNEFRKSNGSKESIEKMYDLMYELETLEKTKQENLVLSNVYILLGFHRSAYEVFKEAADQQNTKEVSKLYVLEQKAKSHENTFILKDLRKYRKEIELPKLESSDFIVSEDSGKYSISKEIVVFNKSIRDRTSIYIPDSDFKKYAAVITEQIDWLAACKNVLIDFYNENNEFTEQKANDDWFDALEIYSLQIAIDDSGNIETLISAGDTFSEDHILDIEITNKVFTSMNYNG